MWGWNSGVVMAPERGGWETGQATLQGGSPAHPDRRVISQASPPGPSPEAPTMGGPRPRGVIGSKQECARAPEGSQRSSLDASRVGSAARPVPLVPSGAGGAEGNLVSTDTPGGVSWPRAGVGVGHGPQATASPGARGITEGKGPLSAAPGTGSPDPCPHPFSATTRHRRGAGPALYVLFGADPEPLVTCWRHVHIFISIRTYVYIYI